MTFTVKVEAINFSGLTDKEMKEKIDELKSVGIRKYFMVEDDTNPEATKTFAEREEELRKQLNKRLTEAKKKQTLEYNREINAAMAEYTEGKDRAIADLIEPSPGVTDTV